MTVHLVIEIDKLKKKLLAMSAMAEEQVSHAVAALKRGDRVLAASVVERDAELDTLEVEIEEDCLKVLALYQPVATDLRFVITALKMNNDLERIGDLAVNIAERCLSLVDTGVTESDYPFDIGPMATKVAEILKLSIDAFIQSDPRLARRTMEGDAQIDEWHKQHFGDVRESIAKNPNLARIMIEFLSVSRYLERVADLATNIAEDVVYLVEGHIVRHSGAL